MYFQENIELIEEQAILDKVETLIENKVKEDRFIDYKRALDLKLDQDKREFCKDVSGLANALGGQLLYGIDEKEGTPVGICGFKIEDIDKFKLQLQNVLNTGVQPRITGFHIRIIQAEKNDRKYILVVSVPRSWQAPHMVVKDQDNRVYVRMNGLTEKADIMQIRDIILEREGVAPQIRAFRQERIEWLTGNDSLLCSKRLLIYHIIPINAFTQEASRDIVGFMIKSNTQNRKINRILEHLSNTLILPNADGVYTTFYLGNKGNTTAFCQYFRNGIVEMVNILDILKTPEGNEIMTNLIHSNARNTQECFKEIFDNYRELNVVEDVFIAVSVLDVKGCRIHTPLMRDFGRAFDRNCILFPEYLTNYNHDVLEVLKPASTLIWQAAGYPEEQLFD